MTYHGDGTHHPRASAFHKDSLLLLLCKSFFSLVPSLSLFLSLFFSFSLPLSFSLYLSVCVSHFFSLSLTSAIPVGFHKTMRGHPTRVFLMFCLIVATLSASSPPRGCRIARIAATRRRVHVYMYIYVYDSMTSQSSTERPGVSSRPHARATNREDIFSSRCTAKNASAYAAPVCTCARTYTRGAKWNKINGEFVI